jgi:serine/threonine-protein kinase HipA
MKRTISVFLGNEARRVGILYYDAAGARERSAFSYDDSWIKAPDCFAWDPGLPLVPGPQFHRKSKDGSVFCAAIADTEPDGWAKRVILRDHAKRRQQARKSGKQKERVYLNELDFLLLVDDSSRVGALRFQDE